MNWQQFRAILWLRWRLRANQWKKGGTANAVILTVLSVAAVIVAVCSFVALFMIGMLVLPTTASWVQMLVWDGLVVSFLFFWAIGLLTELQRSEPLSLAKFMHLPMSLKGAFLINYLSSFFSLLIILFASAMSGLALGLSFAGGPRLLLLLPLLATFFLMVTAVTYQFQGWLASLMVNKRRRRTVIVVATGVFILLCQLPNLVNIIRPWHKNQPNDLAARLVREEGEHTIRILELKTAAQRQEAEKAYQERVEKILSEDKAKKEESNRQLGQQVQETAWIVNLVLPPGWLPLGAMTLAEGGILPALLSGLGMTLIGAASLRRSYRTTLRLYLGHFTSGQERAGVSTPAPTAPPAMDAPPGLLEKQLPWLSEQTSAIALACFRSLTRAPEAKMVLLTPVMLLVVFGSMFLSKQIDLPMPARPLPAFAAMMMILLSMIQLTGNQFGFDRNGFRVFVLCAAPRRDILLGKNLSVAPLAFGLGLFMAIALQVFLPMRPDHFLAVLLQMVSMYLVFCVMANCLAILTPLHVAAGSMKPSNIKIIPLLLQIAFVFILPLSMAPTLLPLGAEYLLNQEGWGEGLPIYLVLSAVECVVIVYLYRFLLTWQGVMLQAREKTILDVVSTKAE